MLRPSPEAICHKGLLSIPNRRMVASGLLAVAVFSAGGALPGEQDRPAAATLARPCFACHSDQEPSVIPRLGGQPEGTFLARMLEFRDRGVDSVMHRIAKGYREEDYRALARYFAAWRPGRAP